MVYTIIYYIVGCLTVIAFWYTLDMKFIKANCTNILFCVAGYQLVLLGITLLASDIIGKMQGAVFLFTTCALIMFSPLLKT